MKKRFIPIFVLWICAVFTAIGQEASQNRYLANRLIQAEASWQPFPVLSTEHPSMDVNTAYRVQRRYLEHKLTVERLAGFKAGLTSQAGQQKFGVDSPVAGALFISGQLTGNPVIETNAFHRLMVETEIGFIIGAPITQPVPDTSTLQRSIKAIVPVIELPDLRFARGLPLTGADIIAANVAARQFIVGGSQSLDALDPNAVVVRLSFNGHEINQGKGHDAYGDQWQAALWLVNTMIEQGWTLVPGQILLTGALGKMLPGKPGQYLADYGRLGKIAFEIK